VRTIDDLGDLRGRRVLLRCDLNVPLEQPADGEPGGPRITDDGRIRASLPILTRLLDAGARVVVCAHLGRPKGAPQARLSLQPVADRLAELLGRPVGFAIDTVGDRDFALEFAFSLSVIALHLSTWAEEWVLWSTSEFNFIKLPQTFCTGSSIMPQKVNPDVLELTRGKTARVIGSLQTLLVLMKGLPLGLASTSPASAVMDVSLVIATKRATSGPSRRKIASGWRVGSI